MKEPGGFHKLSYYLWNYSFDREEDALMDGKDNYTSVCHSTAPTSEYLITLVCVYFTKYLALGLIYGIILLWAADRCYKTLGHKKNLFGNAEREE